MPPARRPKANKPRRSGSTAYVAFLRGINVGGNKKLRMAPLAQAFQSLGLQNVRTLLASGNVLFESRAAVSKLQQPALARTLERKIQQIFDLEVTVVLRRRRQLQRLLDTQPFTHIKVTPRTRLFVTFLSDKPRSALKIPYQSPDKSFRILSLIGRDLSSVLTLGPQWSKNLRQMDILEKEFGKRITTRTWNTVQRCVRG